MTQATHEQTAIEANLLSAPGIDPAEDRPKLNAALDPDRGPIVDYWSAPFEPERWYFPDGKQYIEFLPMNYGMRSAYNRRTNKEFTVERKSGNAKIKADISGDTDVLFDISIVGWNVLRAGNPVPFTKPNLRAFLENFPAPKLLDDLQKAIEKETPG